MDPGHCALGLSKCTAHICLKPRLGTACQTWISTGKGCLQGPLGQLIQAIDCLHYIIAYTLHYFLQPLRARHPWGKKATYLLKPHSHHHSCLVLGTKDISNNNFAILEKNIYVKTFSLLNASDQVLGIQLSSFARHHIFSYSTNGAIVQWWMNEIQCNYF